MDYSIIWIVLEEIECLQSSDPIARPSYLL